MVLLDPNMADLQKRLHFPSEPARIRSPPLRIFIMSLEIYTVADELGNMIDLLLSDALHTAAIEDRRDRRRQDAAEERGNRIARGTASPGMGRASAPRQIDRPISRVTDRWNRNSRADRG